MRNKNANGSSKQCVDGLYRKSTSEYVGFCWYKKHKGFLTLKLMKEHQCPQKECHYFQKFEDSPHWKKKKKNKQRKKERKEAQDMREARNTFILEIARSCTEQFSFMDFTSGKQSAPKVIVLTYFSEKNIDLSRCADFMSRLWKCEVKLHRIKPSTEVIAQFLQQKKGRIAI